MAEPPTPTKGRRDQVVLLPDGRTLGYAEFGDPEGTPLVNCHGGLTGRLDVEPADRVAQQAGIRILSPDRPGIGRSDRKKGRTIGDWAAD
ncbi:MAG: alpha/beta hydrolase, partial [Acidimicrobiales bacterium]|nr:alpha/beta hydrolase [Acidimicrobiales bacterium]